MNTSFVYRFLFLFALVMSVACDDDEGTTGLSNLNLEFRGLTVLGEGYVYGVWGRQDGNYSYIDEFSLNILGQSTNSNMAIEPSRLANMEGLLITMESVNNIGQQPSDHRLMSGDFVNKGCVLRSDHSEVFGQSVADGRVSYILSSPTNTDTMDEDFGVWFYDLDSAKSTLDLPQLGSPWTYESWVILSDTVVSLGKFTDPLSADNSDFFSGPNPGYSAPGGDLLVGDSVHVPASIFDRTVRITIEPVPDDSESAFAFRPYFNRAVDTIPSSPVMINYQETGMPRGLAVR